VDPKALPGKLRNGPLFAHYKTGENRGFSSSLILHDSLVEVLCTTSLQHEQKKRKIKKKEMYL
jgi:hypothetical protein